MSKVHWCALQILVETRIEKYYLENKFSTSIIIHDQSYKDSCFNNGKNIFKTRDSQIYSQ